MSYCNTVKPHVPLFLHQRANHADQKHKLQKINMLVTTSQYETSSKNNAHLLSQNVEPTRACSTNSRKNSLEQAAFWH